MLAFISRGLEYKSRGVLLRFYKTLVRPPSKYCQQFWAPYLWKDVLVLERIIHTDKHMDDIGIV